MQRWEYCELMVNVEGVASGTRTQVMFARSNGKHEYQHGDAGTLMAMLGEERWELVGATARIDIGITKNHIVTYVFKRPLDTNRPISS